MDQRAGEKLSELISRQVGKVEYYSAEESIAPNLAVHEMRKSFKRLRALLRFYRNPNAGPVEKTRKKIRIFGRKLSPLRESWVNMDLFESSLAGVTDIPGKKLRRVAKVLKLKNQELVTERFHQEDVCESIRDFITRIEPKLEGFVTDGITVQDIADEIGSNYLRCCARFEEMPSDYPAEKLHSLRKQMKRLYYQLDFLWELRPGAFREKTEQLDLINDQLGADHDYYVLTEELRSPEFGFSREELLLIENHICQLRAENLLALRHRLKDFFAESPDRFDQELERLFF